MQYDLVKKGMVLRVLRWFVAATLVLFGTCAYSATKNILVLGDSLSAEYGIPRGTGWVALLKTRLEKEKIDAQIHNASISGETTSGGKARLPSLIKQHDPDVVVIELGGNDGLRGLPLAATEQNLRQMISIAQKAKASVLIVGMRIPPNYGREYTERFFGLYGKLAKEFGTGLVPFLLDGVADDPKLMQPDRIHPVADAQAAMLNNVWPHLKTMFSKK